MEHHGTPPQTGAPAAPPFGRWRVVLLIVVVLVAACGGDASKLSALQELPPDVALLVDETWDRFSEAFAGRLDCMEPVSLLLVRDVADGDAVYRDDDRRIEVEIPTSPTRFPESLVHELAHHMEATCPDHEQIRTSFAAAQGLLAAPGWFGGETWAEVPSENFAEAVVQVVNGERILHEDRIELRPEAVELVRHWGRGS